MFRVSFLIAGVLLFVYLIFELRLEVILSLVERVGWSFLLVCSVYGIYILLRASSLYQCVAQREELSYRHIIGVYFSGEAVRNLTFGGTLFSEPFKALLFKKAGLDTAEALATTLTECFANIAVSAVFALAALLYLVNDPAFGDSLGDWARIGIVFLAGLLLVLFLTGWFRVHWVGVLTKAFASFPWLPGWLKVDLAAVYKVEAALFSVIRDEPKRCARVIATELLAQFVLVFELFLILTLLDLEFPLLYPLFIEAVAKFTRVAFFFVPLQIGAAEGVFTALFELFGLLPAAGFTFSVIRRLRSLVTSGLGLLISWHLLK